MQKVIDIKEERKPTPKIRRLPEWLKVRATYSPNYMRIKNILAKNELHSVCQEAACPNISECFGEGTATFMILGNHCTRGCRFCNVKTAVPLNIDYGEPERLAKVVGELSLNQVVITSVTRDDLPDGGAFIFAQTIKQLRRHDPNIQVEVLVPDMLGKTEAVDTILEAQPEVFAHNVETIRRLYRRVRPGAELQRSLDILELAHNYRPRPIVKTGFMVGLGETLEEIIELLNQIYTTGTQIVTVGQYLRPSANHIEEAKFYKPEEFDEIARIGEDIGFEHVESGPLVRSSYKAFTQSQKIMDGQNK